MTVLPEPLIPPDVDLNDFPFTPIYRARLFGSSFHANSSDSEWRAAVTLWLKSWEQTPAGSLPDDEIQLCRLAELGRDMRTWRKVRARAMHGWFVCSDGRLYHKVIAEVVLQAWNKRLSASSKGRAGALARWGPGNATATGTDSSGIAQPMPENSNLKGSRREEEPPQPPLRGGLPGLAPVRNGKSPDRQRRDASRAAWAASEIARKTSDFDALKQADPIAAEAVRLIGGFHAIGMTNTDRIPQLRQRFRDTYEQLLDRSSHAEH